MYAQSFPLAESWQKAETEKSEILFRLQQIFAIAYWTMKISFDNWNSD